MKRKFPNTTQEEQWLQELIPLLKLQELIPLLKAKGIYFDAAYILQQHFDNGETPQQAAEAIIKKLQQHHNRS